MLGYIEDEEPNIEAHTLSDDDNFSNLSPYDP